MDPELTKFLLSNDEKLVQGYYPKVFSRIQGPALTLQGASHCALHELANLSVSSSTVQKLHVETVQEHFLTSLESWRHQAAVLDAQHDFKEV
ncbi:hypothetical protein GOP47_0016227 [Adiantum capillus-veneris]|uniref:Uncharacterized protein n=1 Tax=Adiantum capillus-veneris TaxID=13818 RepID=A0A9D4ZBJ9_ADICA|nr:hypothetical protein GOP47_0016227 [Adiantum capillus-veneris]